MSLLKEISETPYIKLIAYLFCLSTTVCPGILLLFLHKSELFTTINFVLLIILAMAITNPIFLTNVAFTFQFLPFEIPYRFEAGIFIGSLTTYLIFGTILLLDFFFNFTLKLTVICIVIPEFIWILLVIFGKEKIRAGFIRSSKK